jgi:acetyl esterase/lipase
VGGASSGATLAALTALAYTGSDTVKGVDAPAALFSVYGLLDTAHYCAVEGHAADTVGKEPTYVFPDKIDAAIADRDPANASVQAPWSSEIPPAVSLDEARAALGLADWEPDEGVLLRNDLYSYVAAHGNLMDILYRREKFPEGEKGREAFMRHVVANSPTQVLSARTTFPPTFLMHGDADSIVPASQTKDFAAHLSRLGVAHQVYYEPGAGHVYDFAFEASSSIVSVELTSRRPRIRGGRRTSSPAWTFWTDTSWGGHKAK